VSRRHERATLPREQLVIAWQSASLLLGYPDDPLLDRLGLVERASARLPEDIGRRIRETVARLREVSLEELQADYVETFDSQRRYNLFLTYFAHGDTRKRGMALLRFKQTYLRSGFVLDADPERGAELPDHLCVVLEYAATVDQERGRRLLLDHRAGLELLRLSLAEKGSRWAGAVAAASATLPPLRGDETEAVRRLAAEGPPEEEVGLTPYAVPDIDESSSGHRAGPVSLPEPFFPGVRS
jgi:nitrate reductase delta subunit